MGIREVVRRHWGVLAAYPDFLKLFGGTTVSQLGSSVTTVALPLTGVVFLDATPWEMGLLGAAGFVPFLVLGLPAGVWVDRLPYRTVLVLADLSRALLFGAIPALAAFGVLRMWQLYVLSLLAGIGTLFDSLVSTTFVPRLVGREHLLQANAAQGQSMAVTNAGGSAIGGALVQLLTAPIAIAVDAASFVLAAICKAFIGEPGVVERRVDGERESLWTGIGIGVRAVFGRPILRALIISAMLGATFGQAQAVVVMLFFAGELGLEPGLIGVVVAVSGVSAVLGAAVASPATERFGHGATYFAGIIVSAAAGLVLAAAGGPLPLVVVVVVLGQLLRGAGNPLYSVNQVTIRQTLTPPELLARVNATWRFLVFGAQPLGALLGGALGGAVGLRMTLVLSSLGMAVAVMIAALSPIRSLRTLPG